MSESALIVAVPEAEPLVGRFRERYDSSAAVGVPAHVTLLYPFVAPEAIDDAVTSALTALFASAEPCDIVFSRCARFEPRVLYLAPEPEDVFLRLMHRIYDRWPECPPYHGTIPAHLVCPHLTVSDSIEGEHLDRIELSVAGGLPIWSRLAEALLIDNVSGRWTTRARFAIG